VATPAASQSLRIAVNQRAPTVFQPANQIRCSSFFTRQIEDLKKNVKDDDELKSALEDLERDLKKLEKTASFEKVKKLLESKMENSQVGGIMGVAQDVSKVTKDVYHTIADSDLAKKTAEELKKVGQTASRIPGVSRVTATLKSAAESMTQTTKDAAETAKKSMDEKRQQRLEEKKKRQDAHFESFKEDKYVSPESAKQLESSWDDFRKNDSTMQKIFNFKQDGDKSVLGNLFHTLQSSLQNMFSESDLDKAIKEIRSVNQNFNIDEVFQEMQNYTIPEILESYFEGKKNDLRDWTSFNAYSFFEKLMDQRASASQTIESKVTDIRDLKLVYAKLLDKNPVLVFSFLADQATTLRDKSGNIIEGKEGDTHTVHYVMSIAKDSNFNKMTEGWKVLDIAIESPENWQQQEGQFQSQHLQDNQQQQQQNQSKVKSGQMKKEELGDWSETVKTMEQRQDEESSNIHSMANTGTWDKDPGLENKENWNKTWEKNKDKLKEKNVQKNKQ
jgi:hypothetical protein